MENATLTTGNNDMGLLSSKYEKKSIEGLADSNYERIGENVKLLSLRSLRYSARLWPLDNPVFRLCHPEPYIDVTFQILHMVCPHKEN